MPLRPRKLCCGEQSLVFDTLVIPVFALLAFCLAATRAFTPMRPAIRLLRQGSLLSARRQFPAVASVAFSQGGRCNHHEVVPPLHSAIPDIMSIDNEKKTFTPYERWVRRLYQTNLFHPVKLGLRNMEELHEMLGRPMDNVSPFVPRHP